MKSIKLIYCMMLLAFIALTSCSDDNNVDLSNRRFIRIDQSSLTIAVGEKIKVSASVDGIQGDSYKLSWSVLDSKVATAQTLEGNAGVLTAVAPGKTVIKVETTDGKLMYFADLTVTEETRTIKILTIGSGLADDATANYLYDMAKSAGTTLIIGNVYTEGASLADHLKNITEGNEVYLYNRIASDGTSSIQKNQSLKSIVKGANWDFIALEESLPLSGKAEGYQASLPPLLTRIQELTSNPDVKYLLHQPWAYAQTATEVGFGNYDKDQMKMFNAIVEAVWGSKEPAQIDLIVPTGTAVQNGRTSYLGEKMLKDDIHLNTTVGKFMAACTWYEVLWGKNGTEISYKPDNLTNFESQLAKEAARSAVTAPKAITDLVDYKEQGPNEFILDCPIYIDFGPIISAAPFNNYRFPTDPALGNLKDEKGCSSAFGLGVQDGFSGTLERGLENTLGFPKTASEDMFFSDGAFIPGGKSSLKLTYLNKNHKYSFIIFGSINDGGTQTKYTAIGRNEAASSLVTDYNDNKIALVEGIAPAEDGSILIVLQPGPDNIHWAKFIGINAMMITPEGYKLPSRPE